MRNKSNNSSCGSGGENTPGVTATLSGTKPDTTVTGTVTFTRLHEQVRINLDISVPKKANSSVKDFFTKRRKEGA